MTGKVLELENVLSPDMLATRITDKYVTYDNARQLWKQDKEEIRRYVYATDTRHTSNNQTPWKNTTTVPKLCQIRDNLYSNYTATLFPQRKWLIWEANEQDSASRDKRDAITNYMSWVISQASFKHEMDKLILDYIDFGNCFGTVEWVDQRVQDKNGNTQAGYVGPAIRRINPLDIVMNPTAENFLESPKIIRSLISLGELREHLNRLSNDENRQMYEDLFNYLKNLRLHAANFNGDWVQKDNLYRMDGFSSFREYLMSDSVEVLTFYGDWYDVYEDKFEKNRVISVVDRHKLISDSANPSYFGYPPIYHAPWRKRQDNLWGMGPLDNLIGMQYRMDHIENMGADIWDLTSYPVQKIKGFVEDFVWRPGEKIFLGDEGEVDLVVPEVNIMQSDMKIEKLQQIMEEMAGAPKEAMGFRTPGEKTKYEVQRLENASARVFQNKIKQFEEQIVEPLLNAMLELAKRNMNTTTTIKVFDNDYKISIFQQLDVEDITGVGRIKPVAARHFAEQADLIQNMTNLTNSGLWQLVQPHFSGTKMAKIVENIFNLEDYEVVLPFVGVTEQAEGQKLAMAAQAQVHRSQQTATGMGDDFDLSAAQSSAPGPGNIPPQPMRQ